MTTAPVDPTRCPLCGEDNDCGMVKGESTCWCTAVTVPREVSDRISPEAQGVACVCRTCATGRRHPAQIMRQIQETLKRR
ncbi:MAG: cysteine-rich CWC family protein [Polyangiaceae bacterium]|nr:cysteine-rich CWC family protein [Polyangiaceae bacterium]